MILQEALLQKLWQTFFDLLARMVPVLAMTVTNTEEMLEGASRAFSWRHKNVAILVHFPRIVRNKSDSRCERILCNNISLNVSRLIKCFEIVLKLCLLLSSRGRSKWVSAAVPLSDVINWFVYRWQINMCFLLLWGSWNGQVVTHLVSRLWLTLVILFRSLLLGPCAQRLLMKRLLLIFGIRWFAGTCE